MVKEIYKCYINSQNRDLTEPNFRIYFSQGSIIAEENETISVKFLSFDMMYQVIHMIAIINFKLKVQILMV